MKHIRIGVLPGIALLTAMALLAAPAAADSSKTPAEFYELNCVASPGTVWTAGNTMHVRGATSWSILYDTESFEIVGSNALVGNINIDLETGHQSWFGTFSSVYFPESLTGTFDGTWTGKSSPEKLFVGKAVGQGTGELRGRKAKLTLQALDPSDLPVGLLIILSQPPWTECAEIGGVVLDSGRFQGRG